MDPYSLKRDNRKKFFDKEKLKRKHATPSDRKYRVLNKAENPQEEELKPELQPNDYRYHEDITMAHATEDFSTQEVNRKLKQILKDRKDSIGEPKEEPITKRNLESMDVDKLNSLLGRAAPQKRQVTQPDEKHNERLEIKDNTAKPIVQSHVPEDLENDQDFLDGIL